MKYKVIPGPRAIEGSISNATEEFEKLINANSTDGWKYHSMEVITSVKKPGCGQTVPETTELYMLIFYKED